MNQIKMLGILLLLLVPIAYADIQAEIGLDSQGGDIDIYDYPNSGTGKTNYYLYGSPSEGDTNYYMNGGDFETTVEQIASENENTGNSIFYVMNKLAEIFMTFDRSKNEWSITDPMGLNYIEWKFRATFDQYFVPRAEYEKDLNYLANEILKDRLEILAIEEMLQPSTNATYDTDKLCDAKLKVAKQLNLTSVECGDITYYNHLSGDVFLGIRTVEYEKPPVVINDTPEHNENLTQLAIDAYWQRIRNDCVNNNINCDLIR